MKIVVAPDSFKHSLSAVEVAAAISKGIRSIHPEADIIQLPVADGGEGTVEALTTATGGKKINIETYDPLMRPITATYGFIDSTTAVIEMAAASGLERLQKGEENPLKTSTYGTGLLMLDAIKKGARKIITGVGGSATNDAGAGMARAMGAILKDKDGHELEGNGKSLQHLHEVHLETLKENIRNTTFVTAVDVDNPLLGPSGATYVYGGQKGAGENTKKILEKSLTRFADVMEKQTGKPFRNMPGAGAAGGMAAGMVSFLNAELQNGFTLISELCQLEETIKTADFVITGEGKLDEQTAYGKTPYGVAKLAQKHNKPVFAFAGALGNNYQKLLGTSFTNIYPITEKPVTLEEALSEASQLLERAAARMMRSILLFRDTDPFH
ncbi:MAG: glycerate kinase [Bacteroidota bacterium]